MVFGSMKKFRKNLGFTLAEVLITLGIIGIVAAMVIPSLINAYQKHVTVTRLKQTYAQLKQAVKLSEGENGDVTGWDMSTPNFNGYYIAASEKFAKAYIIPYLKYNYICDGNKSYCAYNNYGLNGRNISGVKKLYGIVLLNGVIVRFWPRNHFTEMLVDINGSSGPNISGKDLFSILIMQRAENSVIGTNNAPGVYLYGEGKERNVLLEHKYGCNKTGNFAGNYCGALIKEDGWKISKDYPW